MNVFNYGMLSGRSRHGRGNRLLLQAIGQKSGGGNILKSDSASYKITDLTALNCKRCRLALFPHNDYFQGETPSPSNNDAVILALLTAGITPYVMFEFYSSYLSSDTGVPARNYADFFSIGAAFATRFAPKSSFLVGQGIPVAGITEWASMNEPDSLGSEDPALTYAQYAAMLEGLADGVHSIDPTASVYPGGYLSGNRDAEYTGHGYATAIAGLINDRTLAGIDLHVYHDKSFAPIFDRYNKSTQFDFDSFISAIGITISDVSLAVTEHNVKADSVATTQGYDEPTARRWFLTHFFDVHGVVNTNSKLVGGPRLPWNLWLEGADWDQMASSVSPRVTRWTGITHALLMSLLHDMTVISSDPKGTGIIKLSGAGRIAWVFQNIHPSWSSLYGSTITLNDVPPNLATVDIYDGTGLLSTVSSPSSPSHVFSTPTGVSYLLLGTMT